MKRIRFLLLLLLLLPVPAFADPASALAGQDATLRDEKGKTSTTTRTRGSTTTFRDAQGRMTGTATQSAIGKQIVPVENAVVPEDEDELESDEEAR